MAGRSFTVAGTSWTGSGDERGLATNTSLVVSGLAGEQDGGFLVADSNRIWRVRPSGRIAVVAGNGRSGFSGDGGPATAARLSSDVHGIAMMADGGFLIADTYNDRVRRVWPDGRISTVAGGGQGGDGVSARGAELSTPSDVAALPDGGFLIAEFYGSAVRRVWPDGRISTVAGNGEDGFFGDGGPATAAALAQPTGVAAMADGGFLIADFGNGRVRRVWPDGHISTVGGGGNSTGDSGPATAADLGYVQDVAVLPDSGFVIAERAHRPNSSDAYDRVERVWPDGHISTVTGGPDPAPSFFGNGGPATEARFSDTSGGGQWGSVEVLRDGGILSSIGDDVRLVVGSRGSGLLLAGIRPLAAVVSKRGYRLRLMLNKPARITARLYRQPNRGPVAIARAFRRAGQSTLSITRRRILPYGLYALDVRAESGSQSTRTVAWAYFGGQLTESFIHSLQTKTEPAAAGFRASDPSATAAEWVPPTEIIGCHQFSPSRVDCRWTSYDQGDWVSASVLTPQGQIYTRKYGYSPGGKPGAFNRKPRWQSGLRWEDIDLMWGVTEPVPASPRGLG